MVRAPHLLIFIISLFLCFSSPLHAELLVVEIIVNESPKGEFFVDRDEEGGFWIPVEAVSTLGLLLSPVRLVEKSGKSSFSFNEYPDISGRFDEQTLSLRLTAPSRYFPETDLDLSSNRQKFVLRPDEDSFFLNYQLEYDHDSQQTSDAYGVETEFGIRRKGWLFLSGQRLAEDGTSQSGMSRLMTLAQYEWRSELKRLTIGDFLSTSDTLAPGVRLVGVTLSRNFDLDPQFVQYPTLDYSGSVSSPAEIDIYLNELKIRSEKLTPGNFRLENFTGMMGYGDIEVVVRDSFGRETRLKSPYYLTNRLLKTGLEEYSYSLGLLRENYGTQEDQYGSPLILGYHRYGWKRNMTVGYRLYADDSLVLLTPQADVLASTYGLFNLASGFSNGDNGSGAAATVRYSFNRRPFSFFVNSGLYSSGFSTSSVSSSADLPKSQLGGGVGWGTVRFGSFSFDMSRQQQQNGEERTSLGVSYSKNLFRQVSLTVTSRRSQGDIDSTFTYIAFNYMPVSGPKVTARYEEQTESRSYTVQMQENAPSGPGYGYLAAAGQRAADSATANYFASSGELKREYGVLNGDFRIEQGGDNGTETAFSLSAAGALTWVGGVWKSSRPVRDSFALVQAGTLEGVSVSRSGQVIGRTDRNGMLIIPEINAYYDNHIAIDDKDVPFNFYLPSVDQYLSPPDRSGSCVIFTVEKSRPVTGMLHVATTEGSKPLEYVEVELTNERGEKQTIPTGRGGEFYFDPHDFKPQGAEVVRGEAADCRNLIRTRESAEDKTESYAGVVSALDDSSYPFTLNIPPGDDILVDLGRVVVTMEKP